MRISAMIETYEITTMRCNRCREPLRGGSPYDGACSCGGLVEASETIFWNVTAIKLAARNGLFGPAVSFAVAELTDPCWRGLDREKVERFRACPEALAAPAIAIEAPEPGELLCFVDGNHRITALQANRADLFWTFVVPSRRERLYRLRVNEEGVAVMVT